MVLGLPKWHAQKVVKKWPKSGQKRVPAKSETIKTQILFWFLTNRKPKMGAAAEGPLFGWRPKAAISICQKPKQNGCFYGPRFCWDPFWTTFWTLFDHFLGMSSGKAQNHSRTTFWPFLLLGTLGGHHGYKLTKTDRKLWPVFPNMTFTARSADPYYVDFSEYQPMGSNPRRFHETVIAIYSKSRILGGGTFFARRNIGRNGPGRVSIAKIWSKTK